MNFELISKLLPLLFSNTENSQFNINSFKPIISAFMGSEEKADALILAITKILSGEIDIKALLPKILPLVIGFFQEQKNTPIKNESVSNTEYHLEPIQNLCDEQTLIYIEDYFNSNSAS